MDAQLSRPTTRQSLVVGVTKMAWMYGKSRDWAERLFRGWEEQQQSGTAPIRVFRQGRRGSLFTTLAIIHQHMPPGRDLVLYRRMSAVEADVALAHSRIDQEIRDRQRADLDIEKRIPVGRRPA